MKKNKYIATISDYLKEQNEEPTNFGKAISASSRFKPREMVVFDPPIIGENGNKLVYYQWAYEMVLDFNKKEGELVSKRVSDWSQAENSAETGRDIVHKFGVLRKDGVTVVVSSESVPSLLGYVDAKEMKKLPSIVSSVKTLAKQRMQLAILKAQESEYNAIKKEVLSLPKPNIVLAEIDDLPKIVQHLIKTREGFLDNATYFKVDGTQITHRQDSNVKQPDNKTKEQLYWEWENDIIKNRGGVYPKNLYELERRVERQEKKVEQATNSKINIQ